MQKIKSLLVLLIFTAFVMPVFASANYVYEAQDSPSNPLKGQVVFVPYGITTRVVLNTQLNSETSTLGSMVTATLAHDFSYNGKTIAPKGSVFTGSVIAVKKARHASRGGEIMVKFYEIKTPQNFTIPISAIINTTDKSGMLRASATKDTAIDYAKDTGIGAGGGAILGTALGALAQGSVGLGAVYGTALGAGLGVAKASIDKGDEVVIPANSVIEVYFNQPITTAPNSYQY